MTLDISDLLGRLSAGNDLTQQETANALDNIMRGEWSKEQMGLFLTALHHKGETVDEVAGAAATMRNHMRKINACSGNLLDTCGTGGGGSQMFNVSTTTAIVAAAAGIPVAKHGNRSITSKSGSADVLSQLGVNIEADHQTVEYCLENLGIAFCFAPMFHPAMRHVAEVRRSLGIRTIFNVLGPLANPAGAPYQLLGVGRPELRPLLAGALQKLGTQRAFVVSGCDGLGDVTLTGATDVSEVSPDGIRDFQWTPEDFGIARQSLDDCIVSGPEESADMVREILGGKAGAGRDLVVVNAAAGILVTGVEANPQQACLRAAEAIDKGRASQLLAELAELSHRQ